MVMCFMVIANSLTLRTLQELETTKGPPTPTKKYSDVLMQKTQLTNNNVVPIRETILSSAIEAGRKLLDAKNSYVFLSASKDKVIICIQVIEYLKARVEGLHVEYRIWNKDKVRAIEEYQSGLENMPKITFKSSVPMISVVLTKNKGDSLKNSPGYLAPGPVKQMEAEVFIQQIG